MSRLPELAAKRRSAQSTVKDEKHSGWGSAGSLLTVCSDSLTRCVSAQSAPAATAASAASAEARVESSN